MFLRTLLKAISWLATGFSRQSPPDVIVLMYHRVTGDVLLELDLPFPIFHTQMRKLAQSGQVVSMDEAVLRLESGERMKHPLYVITFDDAFKDFYTHVFPLLRDLQLPVTLYVPTGFLDSPHKPPISRQIVDAEKLTPITWAMLDELAACPLVTVAGHTHSHLELPSLPDEVVLAELARCDTLLEHRLGRPILHFAYPRGVWDERVEQLVKSRYATVAIASGGAITSIGFRPYRIPRVPVLRSDGMFWFSARITGRLIYEEQIVKFVKRLRLQLSAREGT